MVIWCEAFKCLNIVEESKVRVLLGSKRGAAALSATCVQNDFHSILSYYHLKIVPIIIHNRLFDNIKKR